MLLKSVLRRNQVFFRCYDRSEYFGILYLKAGFDKAEYFLRANFLCILIRSTKYFSEKKVKKLFKGWFSLSGIFCAITMFALFLYVLLLMLLRIKLNPDSIPTNLSRQTAKKEVKYNKLLFFQRKYLKQNINLG